MNSVKDLRAALMEEVQRLQPPAGLESRILHQALDGIAVDPPRGEARRARIRSWESRRRTPLTTGVRTIASLVAVLLILLILVGLVLGGRLLHQQSTVPASPTNHALARSLSGMVTSTVGWRGGGGEEPQRTTDAGAHWAYAGPPVTSYVPAPDDGAYFLDATHAWLTTTKLTGPLRSVTFRTADGGKKWDQGTGLAIVDSGLVYPSVRPRLYFLDSTHGWLLLSTITRGVSASATANADIVTDAIYGTADGGLHWSALATNVHAEGTGCDWMNAAFGSVTDGWLTVACGSKIDAPLWLATHDGGKTWASQTLLPSGADLPCPCDADPITVFDREDAAIVVRGFGNPPIEAQVLMTTDGGNTWSARSRPGAAQLVGKSFPGADFIDPKHGFAVAGPSGLFATDSSGLFLNRTATMPLYRTDDGGLTWVPVVTNLPFQDLNALTNLYFVDLQHGFLEGPQFLKTEDGGRHWAAVVPTADYCPVTLSSRCNISAPSPNHR